MQRGPTAPTSFSVGTFHELVTLHGSVGHESLIKVTPPLT